jgi:hypothetical protein
MGITDSLTNKDVVIGMKTMTRMLGCTVELGSGKCYETEKYDN